MAPRKSRAKNTTTEPTKSEIPTREELDALYLDVDDRIQELENKIAQECRALPRPAGESPHRFWGREERPALESLRWDLFNAKSAQIEEAHAHQLHALELERNNLGLIITLAGIAEAGTMLAGMVTPGMQVLGHERIEDAIEELEELIKGYRQEVKDAEDHADAWLPDQEDVETRAGDVAELEQKIAQLRAGGDK